MVADSELQRIARLTPLADVLNGFQTSISPVEPREEALAAAAGKTLAADVAVAETRPPRALALRDGFAVRADLTSDAGSYAPAPLSPKPIRVELGEALPDGTDAVAAFETITARGEATAPVAPGEGVLPVGGDAAPGVLRLAGARLRPVDVALMHALGVERVLIREPRVRVAATRSDAIVDAAARLIAGAIGAESGAAIADGMALEAALTTDDADAVVVIGGTGSGRNDASVRTLARLGRVEHHGIGIAPGETTTVGFVGTRPVLLLPGRFDAALAGWLTVGRRLLARLAFRMIEEQPFLAELSRKVASPLGLAEVVPVRRRFSQIEPMASAYLAPQTLARADGWILVPADSEGYAEGTKVPVRPWP
jgi:molybdopterin biosynthesis enzyme